MSYGDASLDLTSFSIACLSGLNGAGKSALLDAVTWALWESARATSDELIRAGETEMWVDLTFELEGHSYRVRRSRQRSFPRAGARATSKGTLEFQVLSGSTKTAVPVASNLSTVGAAYMPPASNRKNGKNGNGGSGSKDSEPSTDAHWNSLTAASMRETQTRICEVLRMDYDTFINSVYLRQGRADEFTTRPPAERKQVLAEILGLSYFDRLQELAKEQARTRKGEIDALQSNLGDAQNVSAQVDSTKQEWQRASELLEKENKRRQEESARLAALNEQLTDLATIEGQLEPTRQRLSELDEDVESLASEHTSLQARVKEIELLLASVEDAEEVSIRFRELRTRVEKLDEISLERQELETRRLELRSSIATMHGRMEVELEHLQTQLQTLETNRKRLTTQLSARDKHSTEYEKYKELIKQEAELAARQEAFTQLSARAEQLHTLIVEAKFHLEAQIEQKEESLKELTGLIQSKDALFAETAALESQLEDLERSETEFEHIEEQGLKLKQQIDSIDAHIVQLRKQQDENNHKCKELHDTKSLTMCPLCAAPIVDRAAVLTRYEHLHQDIERQISDLENEKTTLEEKRKALRQKYIELKRKLDSRKILDTRIGEFNARKAALERADSSHARLTTEIADCKLRLEGQRYAEIERESLINIKAELHKLEFDPIIYSSLQSQIRSLRHLDAKHQQLKRDQSDLEQLEKDIPALQQKVQQLSQSLTSNDFAPAERKEIEELNAALEKFPYDRSEHQALKQELSKLLPVVDKLKEVERALTEKPEVTAKLASARDKLEAKQAQKGQLEQSIELWLARLDRLPALKEAKQLSETALAELEIAIQQLDRQTTVLHTQLEQLYQQLAVFEQKQHQLDEAITEMNDYNLLAEALGKKGIQAVIIENAVPEIEAEANRILSRLSDNQMHVALVTQQRTKQGNISETLDIVIADQMGTRSYELYSGGEAFKINFAIRLALSRLLARRAGAKLQSLIIDEGFGSQDEVSRMRLIKAINAIRSDFARILIVTHIPEVKESFPVQIQVQKLNGLSTVNLVHAF